jgi:uncharacterized protein (TIGR00156 family)
MKKYIFLLLAVTSTAVLAAPNTPQQGGFVGPSTVTVSTVKVARKAKDDTAVTLKGYIVADLGGEKYTFKDDTGEMVIEIDNKDWNGITVTPETKLMIQGEVDSDLMTETTIDVNSVTLVK